MRRRIPADPQCAASQGVGEIHTALFGHETGPLCELSRSLRTSVTQFENGPRQKNVLARSLLVDIEEAIRA